ncbi:MAG: Flagellin protein FlaA, partial [uncultured Solirubrobacteraceae bacterium]
QGRHQGQHDHADRHERCGHVLRAALDDGARRERSRGDRHGDQQRRFVPRAARRGLEPSGAQPPGRRCVPGEPGRRRVAHPRRGHGAGDGALHEVLDPRAGRPGDARPGQPGPAVGPSAPSV